MGPKAKYAEKLLDPRWQKMRLEVLERDNWTCILCGATKETLHVHHHWYADSGNPWDVSMEALTTFCDICHEFHHNRDIVSLRHRIATAALKRFIRAREITNAAGEDPSDEEILAKKYQEQHPFLNWLSGDQICDLLAMLER